MWHYWKETRDRLGWTVAGTLLMLFPVDRVAAQIIPDGTLGTQVNGSATAPCAGICTITNGQTRGSNRFHSFQQFSLLDPADRAIFQTTPAIQNLFVRVTGVGQPFISNINGVIATDNPTNFFLLNPNGILFGPGARLNIGGSFLATTADLMQFQDGQFSTIDPAPILSVNVPIGLQYGSQPAPIQLQGTRLAAGQTDTFSNFTLVGGDITLDNSIVRAPGHRVELAGVGENGTVGLVADRLNLSLAAGAPRRDLSLSNKSIVNASASKGNGEVMLAGGNIFLDGSAIFTGILPGIDNDKTSQTGNIVINASANLQLTQGSLIINAVYQNTIGQGGNVNVVAADIRESDNSTIGNIIAGNGDGGNLQSPANSIALDNSSIISEASEGSNGNAGNVIVNTGSLTATSGGGISASTSGDGNGGNVRVVAKSIALDGTTPDAQFGSGIASQVTRTGSGQGGDIIVETSSLTVTNGAVVTAGTSGSGNGGNVRVVGKTVALDGTTPDSRPGGIGSESKPTASGQGGNVAVEAGLLTVSKGAAISARTGGSGNGGNVRVIAHTIALDGTSVINVGTTGSGQGGNITVETDSLIVTNGAAVTAGTFGTGNGGNVYVVANTIALDGTTPDAQSVSVIDSGVGTTGSGRGGNINLKTNSLNVTNGAAVTASTGGTGDGGNVDVTANTIVLDGTGTSPNGQFPSVIASEVRTTGSGRGGDVIVETGLLTVTNWASVSSSSFGTSSAGNLNISAHTLRLDRGLIESVSFSDDGANILLTVRDLLLMRRGSAISTSAGLGASVGNGGNITLRTPLLVAIPREDSNVTANASQGRGGAVDIIANLFGIQPRPRQTPLSDITASSETGIQGTIVIASPDVDPNRGLVPLPVAVTDPSNKIDQQCAAGTSIGSSQFVVTGQGGLPASPEDNANSTIAIARLAKIPTNTPGTIVAPQKADRPILNPAPIVEAQTAIRQANGRIRLAVAPRTNSSISTLPTPNCQQR
jgi:filamentous hemagglutinin family protein